VSTPLGRGGILLDRDGVLNRERPHYVKRWEEFEFLPGVLPALRRLALLDWPILVISNQSAVGRRLVTVES
jgi:histidinol phosphatase-like enzyme